MTQEILEIDIVNGGVATRRVPAPDAAPQGPVVDVGDLADPSGQILTSLRAPDDAAARIKERIQARLKPTLARARDIAESLENLKHAKALAEARRIAPHARNIAAKLGAISDTGAPRVWRLMTLLESADVIEKELARLRELPSRVKNLPPHNAEREAERIEGEVSRISGVDAAIGRACEEIPKLLEGIAKGLERADRERVVVISTPMIRPVDQPQSVVG